MVADSSVNWYVDYNDENIEDNGKPVGTLRIPCFLIHNGKFIDSRSILKNSCEYVAGELKKLLLDAQVKDMENFPFSEIQDIVFTTGTELEFWVKTPSEKETVQHLSISQRLQEQYWQRMRGNVRTAMEQTIEELDARGLHVEMGHKEVGGIKPKVDDEGHIFDVCEQLELDWLFSTNPLQAADNELEARIVVREVFRRNGLDVSFRAKPIIGVAGSGEHTHVGIAALLKNGKTINLLAPEDMKADFLSTIGYGFIMGILNNYEATNPFVSSTTDAFNRLKPGFEAPVCIVTSLGHTPAVPSRNRSILMGLIRDIGNPKATRFELRAPNPFTNTYLAVSCLYLTALDGIEYALKSNKSAAELLAELSKKPGEDADYLEKGRAYRCEENVFEAFTDEERDAAFGKPPTTVWENVKIMKANPDKVKVITKGDILSDQIVDSFLASIVYRWKNELIDRIIPGTEAAVRGYKKLDNDDKIDERRWKAIKAKRIELAKDTDDEKCVCTRLKDALESGDYDTASDLQLEMTKKAQALEQEYHVYALNILD
jgi:glutamine synthetase